MNKGYDRIAGSYDFLSRLVFGKKLLEATMKGLEYLRNEDSILVVGGGSGKVLKALNEGDHKGRIVFIDRSEKMIAIAKKSAPDLDVEFVAADLEQFDTQEKFDAIHVGFFLDQFQEVSLRQHIQKLSSLSREGALWMISDFVRPKGLRRKLLLFFMYRFFRVMTGIEASYLEDIPGILNAELGTLPEVSEGDWIWHAVYRTSQG